MIGHSRGSTGAQGIGLQAAAGGTARGGKSCSGDHQGRTFRVHAAERLQAADAAFPTLALLALHGAEGHPQPAMLRRPAGCGAADEEQLRRGEADSVTHAQVEAVEPEVAEDLHDVAVRHEQALLLQQRQQRHVVVQAERPRRRGGAALCLHNTPRSCTHLRCSHACTPQQWCTLCNWTHLHGEHRSGARSHPLALHGVRTACICRFQSTRSI